MQENIYKQLLEKTQSNTAYRGRLGFAAFSRILLALRFFCYKTLSRSRALAGNACRRVATLLGLGSLVVRIGEVDIFARQIEQVIPVLGREMTQ